jgi:MoaA/NifB/PqqE/SkfB family radical SAM enzyme
MEMDPPLRFTCIVITHRCPMRCRMCYNWQSKERSHELSVDEWRRFIDSIREVVELPFNLIFAGGEPFIYKGIFELIRHAHDLGMDTYIATSALMINERFAEKIRDARLSRLGISIDGLQPATQNYLRGLERSYDSVMEAIENLYRIYPQMPINILTVIMEQNLDELEALARWVKHDRRLDQIAYQAVVQTFMTEPDREWYRKEELNETWPKDLAKVHAALDKLIELKSRGYPIANPISQFEVMKSYFEDPNRFVKRRGCNVGNYGVHVDPNGDVFLCHAMRPIGNARHQTIRQAWLSETAREVRAEIDVCEENCHLLVNCCYEEECDLECAVVEDAAGCTASADPASSLACEPSVQAAGASSSAEGASGRQIAP